MAVRQKFYQIFSASITSGLTKTFSGNLNILYKKATGIYAVISDATGATLSKFTKFQIDNDDVFPENFEVLLITSGTDVPPDDRFLKLDERAENSPVEMTYVDGTKGTAYPYTLSIYFRLENPKLTQKEILADQE